MRRIRLREYWGLILNLFNYPIFTISLGFISGCFVKENLDWGIIPLVVFMIVFVLCKIRSFRILFLSASFLVAFSLGQYRYDSYFMKNDGDITNWAGESVCILGNIKYQPDSRVDSIKAMLEITMVNGRPAEGLILITIPRYPEYYLGDILEVCGSVDEPENFDDFDYKEYLRVSNVYTVMRSSEVSKIGEISNGNIIKLLSNYKRQLSNLVKKELPQPHASLLLGIEAGSKENMPNSFDENLSITGTTHIIAVSGYNVTVLLAIILKFAGVIPRKYALLLSGLFLSIFLLIVGLDNLPAMRAGIMGFAYLISLSIGRRGGLVSFLPLSAATLIFINPIAYKSLSFQLSFISTLGLIFYSDYFDNLLKRLPDIIRSELSPTLSAMLSTSPIIIYNFGRFSLLSPLVNVLVLPIVPVIMLLGLIYFCSIPLSVINLSFIVYLPLQYMVEVINIFGGNGYGYIEVPQVPTIVFYFVIFILILFALEQNVKKDL